MRGTEGRTLRSSALICFHSADSLENLAFAGSLVMSGDEERDLMYTVQAVSACLG